MAAPTSTGLKLHLGCGSFVAAGWENIDKSWGVRLARVRGLRRALATVGVLSQAQATAVFPEGIVRMDVRRGLSYADGSASAVYTSHMIEHMSRWQALRLLGECRRVLEPGGIIRMATPDLRALVDEYVGGKAAQGPTPADSFMKQLETFREEDGNVVRRLISRTMTAPHQWLYDEESLVHLLEEAGFSSARGRDFVDSGIIEIEVLEQRPGSLFVEATRA